MKKTQVSVHAPAPADALAVIDTGLDEDRVAGAPFREVRPLHVIASLEDGTVVGGAVGRTWGKCCELQQLWVAEDCRGRDEGTRLMEVFEREAKSRGCELVYLDTFSFQAPAFYARRGYEEVLRTEGFADGVTKSTMQKRLV